MVDSDYSSDDDDNSIGSVFSEDDAFDVEDTDVESLDAGDSGDDCLEDEDKDEDAIDIDDEILNGNTHPPEHYRREAERSDEDDDGDGYKATTSEQLDRIEEQWIL